MAATVPLRCIRKVFFDRSYIVPDWIDDGDVTLNSSDENSVGRRSHQSPEWDACEPYATNELIIDTVT